MFLFFVFTLPTHTTPAASVSSFGEISPIWPKFKLIWQHFEGGLFSIWQNFESA